MTTILAFDTTAGCCSVAVWRDGEALARRSAEMSRGHAEALVPMILDTLGDAGTAFADLDAVAATTGPGAFTGIRIGLAAARGIALAADIPAVGISALEAVAAGMDGERARGRSLIVAIDTKRGDFYVQRFRFDEPAWQADGDPVAVDAAALVALAGAGPTLVAGDAARPAAAAIVAAGGDATADPGAGPPDPTMVAALAGRYLAAGETPPPRPLYLREPNARLPQRMAALLTP